MSHLTLLFILDVKLYFLLFILAAQIVLLFFFNVDFLCPCDSLKLVRGHQGVPLSVYAFYGICFV